MACRRRPSQAAPATIEQARRHDGGRRRRRAPKGVMPTARGSTRADRSAPAESPAADIAPIDSRAAPCLQATMTRPADLLAVVAASMGAGGVALAAAATHAGGGEFGRTASQFLILHAAALLGVSAAARAAAPRRRRRLLAAGAMLALGALLFSGDLAWRAFAGVRLFPFAAPSGGSLMILSWAALAVVFALPE